MDIVKMEEHLHHAVDNGHEAIVSRLLVNGMHVDMRNQRNATPLMVAARNGSFGMCRLLLDEGSDVNLVDQYGRTPLSFAAQNGWVPVCQLLIQNGARVDILDNLSNSPVHHAAGNGHLETLRLMRDRFGTDVLKVKNDAEHSSVTLALRYGHIETAQFILSVLDYPTAGNDTQPPLPRNDRLPEQGANAIVSVEDPPIPMQLGTNEIVPVEETQNAGDPFTVQPGHCKATFNNVSHIGHGGFGLVFKAKYGDLEVECAVKRILLKNETKEDMREVRNFMKLQHPNIVEYKGSWLEVTDAVEQGRWDEKWFPPEVCQSQMRPHGRSKYLYIQMELCQRNNLENYIYEHWSDVKNATEFLSYFGQIVSALVYIHHKGFIHRDLKPSNICFAQDGTIKVCDFGLARQIAGFSVEGRTFKTLTIRAGTDFFMSHEQRCTSNYDFKADIYSLGLIFYLGLAAFPNNFSFTMLVSEIDELRTGKISKLPHFDARKRNPERSKILEQMCAYEPEKRPIARQIQKEMSSWKAQ